MHGLIKDASIFWNGAMNRTTPGRVALLRDRDAPNRSHGRVALLRDRDETTHPPFLAVAQERDPPNPPAMRRGMPRLRYERFRQFK